MFYHMEVGQHTQNIQINKVIGENEKRVFYFMGKITYGLFGQPNSYFIFLGLLSQPTDHLLLCSACYTHSCL